MVTPFLLIIMMILPEQDAPFAAYRWQKRIIVVNQQMNSSNSQLSELLNQREEMEDRDLLLFLKEGNRLICQNAKEIPIQYAGNRFSGISLIGKDGGVKLHRQNAVEAHFIFDLIDSMPMRQSEMRRKNNQKERSPPYDYLT